MPTKRLPVVSLRTTDCLPATRTRLRAANFLIYRANYGCSDDCFSALHRILCLLEGGRSADEALGAGRDVVEGEGH